MVRKAFRALRKHTSRILVKASARQRCLRALAASKLRLVRQRCLAERVAHF